MTTQPPLVPDPRAPDLFARGPVAASNVLRIAVPGEIRGKGRHKTRVLPGKRDPATGKMKARVQTYTPDRTVNAEALVAWCAKEQVGGPVIGGPVELTIYVTRSIPASWSKKRQADARAGVIRPTSKPDASNILKLLEDALNLIVWRDDAQIVDLHFHKHYGDTPGAVIEVLPL